MALTLRYLCAIAIIAAVLAGGGMMALRAEAASFKPSGTVCLEDESTTADCDGDSAPGAVPSIVRTFAIPAGDSMPGRVVFFTPPQWSFARGEDVPDGRPVGVLNASLTIGLLNGPCSTFVPVQFNLQDATVDTSDTVLFNEFHNQPNENAEQFQVVDGTARGVTEYPDYLLRILQDGNGNALQPRARYYGQATLAGLPQSVNIVTFDPGTDVFGVTMDPIYGFVSVVVFNNEGDLSAKHYPKAITDVCSPFEMAWTLRGQAGPSTVLSNPAEAGTYRLVTYTADLADADNDGIENGLDTCPFDANPNWNPRDDSFSGDADRDGLPDECDPLPLDAGNPGAGAVNDHDGDYYYNRDDNCPTVKNNLGLTGFGFEGGTSNQGDRDNDGIGDDCDPNPDTPDGEPTVRCIAVDLTIGEPEGPTIIEDGFPCGTHGPCPGGCAPIPTLTPHDDFITATATPGALPEAGGPSAGANPLVPWLVFAAVTFVASAGAALAAAYRRR